MNSSSGLSEQQLTALSSLYVSCLSFSLIGSCSVFITSTVKKKQLKEQAKPLIQLALADLLASLCLTLTALMNFLSLGVVRDSEVLCSAGLALTLTFYCISFLLVVVYACESANSIQGWRNEDEGGFTHQRTFSHSQDSRRTRRRRRINLVYVLVWLLPVIGYVIYIRTASFPFMSLIPSHPISNSDTNDWPNARFCSSCILFLHLHIDDTEVCSTLDLTHIKYTKIFTFTSVLSVLICCTLMYWRLQVRLRRYERGSVSRAEKIWSSARYMILIIVFCWTPALVLIGLSFVCSETDSLFPLFIVQAVSVSLHGFLNSIVYAWRRRNFREAVLGDRTPLLLYTHQAFFEQSLRNDAEETGSGQN
ncbi:uncharacterized protein si:dkey-30c15.2 [Silurus meridionalis]|uniref:G-protein coupled receptors family 1 profile domain-containing protein n=1 Tax=Silurus meridionalis TaxID=175797 RepID=A0A8T0B0F4_SILME|nr:uncharacterized protein si:dkey-30c15.2 [Silurus meridionalis]KAF7699430.1 hypothetical protein HF521_004172 [Silurus meridionalis]